MGEHALIDYRISFANYLTFKSPLDPLTGGKLVLVQIVFVGEITVAVDIACVATEHEHAALVNDGRVVIPLDDGNMGEIEMTIFSINTDYDLPLPSK